MLLAHCWRIPNYLNLHAVDCQRELQELTRTQRRLSEQLKASRAAFQELMAESPVREVLQPVICTLVDQLKVLRRQIRLMVNNLMPGSLNDQGVGPVVAGVLLAEAGDPKRFASANHFASYCGAAPIERGSGQNCRMQVNPGGNRRLNWALHNGRRAVPRLASISWHSQDRTSDTIVESSHTTR